MRLLTCLLLAAAICPVIAAPLSADSAPNSSQSPINDFRWMRGANYVPSYARNDVQTWMDYDPQVIDRELGFAEKLKLNVVRVFLQVAVYERDPERFLANFESFLSLCQKHHIQMMPVVFDSCFGEFPDLERYREKDWMACPGQNRLGPEHWPATEKFVRDVVGSHRDDERIVLWDVMNEPYVTSFNSAADRRTIHTFLGQALEMVRRQQPKQPLTDRLGVLVAGSQSGAICRQGRCDCVSQLRACAATSTGDSQCPRRCSETRQAGDLERSRRTASATVCRRHADRARAADRLVLLGTDVG